MRRSMLRFTTAALLAPWLTAQGAEPTPEKPTKPEPALGPIVVSSYDPGTSWGLFAACDSNSNDRLDLFEAQRGIPAVDPEQRATFRRIDVGADGKIQWLEFDRYFFEIVNDTGNFRIYPARPFRRPLDPTELEAVTSAEAALMRLVDQNDDRRLQPNEFRDFVVAAEFPTEPSFEDNDADKSGDISAEEFAGIVKLLPDGGQSLLRRDQQDPGTLTTQYRAADTSRDGRLDATELQLALITIDPSLRRWTARILQDADFSGNERLNREEIERATVLGANQALTIGR